MFYLREHTMCFNYKEQSANVTQLLLVCSNIRTYHINKLWGGFEILGIRPAGLYADHYALND